MLKNLFLLSGFVVLTIILMGCWERKPTYVYLMLHPDYLQRVYNQCVETVTAASLPCDVIMRAQSDFTSLVNQREQDAERFGAQILQAQENSSVLKIKFNAAVSAYQTVGKTNPSLDALKNTRLEVDKARAAYKVSIENVRILLTVVAATSTM